MLNKKFDILEGDNLDKLMRLATILQKSTLYKDKLSSVEKTAAIMLHGMEVGLSPTQSLKNIDILFNIPTLNSDAQLAIARNSGELEFFEEYFLDKDGNRLEDLPKNKESIEVAVCIMKRKGLTAKTTFYSIEDASKKLLLTKDNWKKGATRMLCLRARSFNTRDNFGDKLAGLQHSTEEMQDSVSATEIPTLELVGAQNDQSIEKFSSINQGKLLNIFSDMADNISSLDEYESCRKWYLENKDSLETTTTKEVREKIIQKLKEKKEEFNKKDEVIVISVNNSELKEAI
jgi:hypothetical protein